MSAEQYRRAGVDLDAADAVKIAIAASVQSTWTESTRGRLGAFAGAVALPPEVERPLLLLSTDGVGTKVLVAIAADRHDTVGEDLVNHCVNDVLVHGARPLAFQDYLALDSLRAEVVAGLVEGIARGCRAHHMTLTGGETAQLPELYDVGHYDLAGTILGVVDERWHLDGAAIRPGDALIGYASTGLHTNGYTLARQVVFETLALDVDSPFPDHEGSVAEVLLAVHRSYAAALEPVLRQVHGLAHVTGGGIPGNLERVLPEGCRAVVQPTSWPEPPVFDVLRRGGKIDEAEMRRVFNLGVGLVAAAAPAAVPAVEAAATRVGIETWVIGEIVVGPREVIFA